jgi:hypothetical protein
MKKIVVLLFAALFAIFAVTPAYANRACAKSFAYALTCGELLSPRLHSISRVGYGRRGSTADVPTALLGKGVSL